MVATYSRRERERDLKIVGGRGRERRGRGMGDDELCQRRSLKKLQRERGDHRGEVE